MMRLVEKVTFVEKSKFTMSSIECSQYNGTPNAFVVNLMDSLIPLTISALTSNTIETRQWILQRIHSRKL